jgi:hypothetical protein
MLHPSRNSRSCSTHMISVRRCESYEDLAAGAAEQADGCWSARLFVVCDPFAEVSAAPAREPFHRYGWPARRCRGCWEGEAQHGTHGHLDQAHCPIIGHSPPLPAAAAPEEQGRRGGPAACEPG